MEIEIQENSQKLKKIMKTLQNSWKQERNS